MIARVTDGLPLAEGLDDGRDMKDAEFYKQQVKALFKNLSRGHNEASRMSIESGPYVFQYPSTYIFHICSVVVVYILFGFLAFSAIILSDNLVTESECNNNHE